MINIFSQNRPIEHYSLIKYIENSHNMYSGQANYSIPIYDSKFNNLDYNLKLQYDGSSFRPNVEPGLTGHNWNLNLIGKIVRQTQKDFFYGFKLGYFNDFGSEMDCIQKKSPITISKKMLLENPLIASQQDIDESIALDRFYFNFFGYNGYFTIDNLNNPLVYCETSSLKIEIGSLKCQPVFSKLNDSEIIITDDSGNKFFFGGTVNELDINFDEGVFLFSDSFYEKGGVSPSPNDYKYSYERNIRNNYATAWNLKKVLFADGTILEAFYRKGQLDIFSNFLSEGKKVREKFKNSFPDKNICFTNNVFINSTSSQNFTTTITPNYPISGGGSGELTNTVKSETRSYSKIALLDSIIYNREKIIFNYDTTTNPIEHAKKYLKSVKIFDNNSIRKEIKFNYDDLGNKYKRTFLSNIEINPDEKYNFVYYQTDNFPAYNAYVLDKAGFWNGKIETEDLLPINNFIKTGLLNCITLPTKGKICYEYENHEYSKIFKSDDLTQSFQSVSETIFPGVRISKEINSDKNSNVLYNKTFIYKDDKNISSGIYEDGLLSNSKAATFLVDFGTTSTFSYVFSSNPLYPNLYSKNLINYSNVIEKTNKGSINYFFTDRITNPDDLNNKLFKSSNSGIVTFYKITQKTNESQRGKIRKIQYFDINNKKKIEKNYFYTDFIEGNNLQEISPTASISDYNYYVDAIGFANKQIRVNYNSLLPYLISKRTEEEYFDSGFKTEKITEYKYNDKYLNWHPFPIETTIRFQGNILSKDKIYYPGDILREKCPTVNCSDYAQVGGQFSIYKDMLSKNIIKPVINIETNSKGISKLIETKFKSDASSSNMIKESKTRVSSLNKYFNENRPEDAIVEDKIIFELYDSKGNLLQFRNQNGISTTIIYGYNQSLPIAKIIGTTYGELMNAYGLPQTNDSYLQLDIVSKSNLHIDETSENILLYSLMSFRNNPQFKNYQITTYTYKPLIGISSITLPNGIREIYKYNIANRLEKVIDINGNIIKEYKYNYAPVSYFNAEKSAQFTRNNCGSSAIGGTYIYTVPTGKYVSYISQEGANQMAQDDINNNGQNSANTNSSCTPMPSCSINYNTNIGINGGGSINVSYNNYKVIISCTTGSNSINLPWNTGVKVATINGDCKPSVDYDSYNGQVYYKIKSNGDIIIRTSNSNPFENNTMLYYYLYFPIK